MKLSKSGLALLLTISCGLTACGGDQTTNNFQPSNGGGGGGGGGNTPVSTDAFYVSVKEESSSTVLTTLHKFNAFTSPCSVSSSATSYQDISCLLNINELDLFVTDLKLVVNVPTSMCAYHLERPYWYYKSEAGTGPSTLTVTVDTDSEAVTACSADGVPGVIVGTSCTVSEGTFDSTGTFSCVYDTCCAGSYSITTSTTTGGNTTTEPPETKQHGGSWGSCAAGAGMDGGDWQKNAYGLPINTIFPASGTQRNITLKSAISLQKPENIFAANMYGWSSYVNGTHAAHAVPFGLAYNTDRSGSTIQSPTAAYEFYCMDDAFEVKHRISLYINEWDTKESFSSYYSSGSTTNSPNADPADIEGIDCASDALPGLPCDDFWDWDRMDAELVTFPGL